MLSENPPPSTREPRASPGDGESSPRLALAALLAKPLPTLRVLSPAILDETVDYKPNDVIEKSVVSDEGDGVERLARVSEGVDDRAGTKSSVSAPAAMEDKDIQEICSRAFARSLDNDWVGKDNDLPRVLDLEEHGATHEPGKRDDGNDALERAFREGEGSYL